MLLEIDDAPECVPPTMATFRTTGPGWVVRAIRVGLTGAARWYAVIGWEQGPVPAQLTPIEESGDGPARLLHGGRGGIRLRALAEDGVLPATPLDWGDGCQDLAEPFLVVTPQAEWRS